jgi:hypothetical protein
MPPVRIPQVVHDGQEPKADMHRVRDIRRQPKIHKGQVQIMQTIEEYQRYTRQLEGEVKKWHDAFDASEVVNRELAAENKRLKEKFAELNK